MISSNISAFGVDHGGISKSYTKNAPKLAAAAAKGSTYAAKRIKAGERGVSGKPGFVGRTAGRLNSSSAYRAIPSAKPGGLARMEARATERLQSANPVAAAAPPGASATPAAGEAAATGASGKRKGLIAGGLALGGVGGGAGGAYAYSNRNRGQ